MPPASPDGQSGPSRRDILRVGGSVSAFLALGSLPVFAVNALAGETGEAGTVELVPAADATTLWTPPAKGTTFLLVNRRSGKAIDVPNGSTANGTALIQYTQHGSPNQRWRLADLGGGIYSAKNVNSDLAADVGGGSSADDAAIIQWPYGGSTNQQWMLSDLGTGYFKIVNVRSGKVIGVRGNSLTNSAAIVQQTDTNDLSQQWSLVAV
ncbi:RICIN domain-containing protein [Actinokineospora sp. HUAS TT18]|uniref:RICIN domain-containing protein n=1 Tax=Actinokineospora sp. HUAS TT18 TaxID=3447451 RepID=UPI003F51DD7D